jgi:hypothetical protein
MVVFVHDSFSGVLGRATLGVRPAFALAFRMLSACKMSRYFTVRECVSCASAARMGMTHAGDMPTTELESRTVMPAGETPFHGTLFAQPANTKPAAEMERAARMFLTPR